MMQRLLPASVDIRLHLGAPPLGAEFVDPRYRAQTAGEVMIGRLRGQETPPRSARS